MAKRTVVTCPNCRTQSPAVIESVIDVSRDPDAKARLLSGRLNTLRCPNCGSPITLGTPILYHDPAHELLMAYIPMELNLNKDAENRVLAELMNELNQIVPKEQFRGYMFSPKQTLTMQGLIDTVLQADGVTPEMMNEQKERVKLIETLLSASPDQIEALIQANDAKIDVQFLQTLSLMTQRMAAEGQQEAAEQMMTLQEFLMATTTAGAEMLEQARQQREVVQAIADEIRALGQNATRQDFIKLVVKYADDDQRLQAIVGLIRPAFDYQFFQELTSFIGGQPADERPRLEAMRDAILKLVEMVDQQAEAAVAEAAGILRALVNSPNPDQLIRENLGAFDDTFMAVLTANIQEAERRADVQTSAKLKDIYNKIMTMMRDTMQPELRFINELIGTPSPEEARAKIQAQASQFGPDLLEWFTVVEEAIAQRGDPRLAERIAALRGEVEAVLK